MHESYFAQLAFESRRMSALPRNQLGKALLGRWDASAWSQPGSAHGSGEKLPQKKRRKPGSLRLNLSLYLA